MQELQGLGLPIGWVCGDDPWSCVTQTFEVEGMGGLWKFVLVVVGWLVMAWSFAAGFGAFLLSFGRSVKLHGTEMTPVSAVEPVAQ